MPINAQFIIICEKAFLTAGSNNLNLIGIFSQINAAALPVTWPQFALVVNFDAAKPGQHVLGAKITDPAGAQMTYTELPVSVVTGNMQVIANFENMRFSTQGVYTIHVSIDGKPLGQRSLRVLPAAKTEQKANLA